MEEEEKEGKEEKDTGEKKRLVEFGGCRSAHTPSLCREKWQIVCSTEEEWDELVASLSTVRAPSVKKLYRALEVRLTDHCSSVTISGDTCTVHV